MSAAQPGNDSANFGEHRERGSTRVLLPMVVVGGCAGEAASLAGKDEKPLHASWQGWRGRAARALGLSAWDHCR